MTGSSWLTFAVVVSAVCWPCLASAEIIEGAVEVIDGDSLRVGSTEVRLYAVDAPELSQTCFSNGSPVACGKLAKDVLEGMIGGATATCYARDSDAYGRTVAVCRTSGVDIGQELVSAGWALAYRRYGDDYISFEARARASRSGIWNWDFQSPEEFRTSLLARTENPQSTRSYSRPRPGSQSIERNGQCLIKGNHSRRGDWIYHLPGMPYYDATRAEAYFCTEEQARAAGYRRSKAG